MSTNFKYTTVCTVHPDLQGKRYVSNGVCPACLSEQRSGKRQRELAAARIYKKENAVKVAAMNQRRKLQLKQATPKWADKRAIEFIYECAEALRLAGEPCEVDHIVPLQHPLVCGLHCEFNLAIMPKWDNLKKGNRTWPDMP